MGRALISFTISWLEQGEDVDLQTIKHFFEILEQTVSFSHVRKKSGKKCYEDTILEVDCSIETDIKISKQLFYSHVGYEWCKIGLSPEYRKKLQWLSFPDEGFWKGNHPEDNAVNLLSLSFGCLIGSNDFTEHLCLCSGGLKRPRANDLQCSFKHDAYFLSIFMEFCHSEECSENVSIYMLKVSYRDICKVVVKDYDNLDLFLRLKNIPLLHAIYDRKTESSEEVSFSSLCSDREKPLEYRRAFEMECSCLKRLIPVHVRGKCLTLKLGFEDRIRGLKILGRLHQRCTAAEVCYSPVIINTIHEQNVFQAEEMCKSFQDFLPFSCVYSFNSVLTFSFDLIDELILSNKEWSFYYELLWKLSENQNIFNKVFTKIFEAIDFGSVILFDIAVIALSEQVLSIQNCEEVPHGTCLVRRAFITPSRTVFLPPSVQLENRVLREFGEEFALRVSFRDDNLEKLRSFYYQSYDVLDSLVGDVMRNGIKIGFRNYQFLAASVSQLRSHGMWFFADYDSVINVDAIRKWMGSFDDSPNVAKLVARMGLCLSSTEKSIRVPLYDRRIVMTIPDIFGGYYPHSEDRYVFSDGIGRISPSLLKKVCQQIQLNDPSAIQIRYAGYKGVLCIHPELKDDCLQLRESMKKFVCDKADYLEVIKASAPRAVYLNRQLITLLDQLGTPKSVLLNYQLRMLLKFIDALSSEDQALELLSTTCRVSLPFRRLYKSGFSFTTDPFYRSILLSILKFSLESLRYKTRIAVPVDLGRNLLGVLDETRTLESGQVYIQISELTSDSEVKNPSVKVITGRVLVTKCPCLHPGDVRILDAVDSPKLSHIKDCLVIPAKGYRPHSDEISGSDLDGDEYIVIWDHQLLFEGGNRKPMDFPAKSSRKHQNTFNLEDEIKFICSTIRNDSVGILANAHLAWADRLEKGIFSPTCLDIASRMSQCIDYAKTGEAGFMKGFRRPSAYPDFMEKGGLNATYKSERVLGKLYRNCRALETLANTMNIYVKNSKHTLLEFPGWEEYEEKAKLALQMYNNRLLEIINQNGLSSEAELFTCLISSSGKYNRESTDKLNVQELAKRLVHFLFERTREMFFTELEEELKCKNLSEEDKLKEKYKKASSWYLVAYKDACYFSFPWCIADVLVGILERSPIKLNGRNTLREKINDIQLGDINFEDACLTIINYWIIKENQNKSSEYLDKTLVEKAFHEFYDRVCTGRLNSDVEGTSDNDTSVGGLLIGFLKFCTDPGNVCNILDIDQAYKLSTLALKTFGEVSVCADLCCIGFECNGNHAKSFHVDLEARPLRIAVTDELRSKLSCEEIRRLLKSWFELEELYVRFQRDQLYLNFTGNALDRWLFEKYLLKPELCEALLTEDRDLLLKVS